MLSTTVHHTCENRGNAHEILGSAPFASGFDYFGNDIFNVIDASIFERSRVSKKFSMPFMGPGFYFWDNNIEQARIWGEDHYNGSYVIVEGEFYFNYDTILDLVANRDDMKFFMDFANGLIRRTGQANWSVGEVIFSMLLYIRQGTLNHYFDHARAVDVERSGSDFKFSRKHSKYFTYLNPCITICMYEKTPHLFGKLKIVESK